MTTRFSPQAAASRRVSRTSAPVTLTFALATVVLAAAVSIKLGLFPARSWVSTCLQRRSAIGLALAGTLAVGSVVGLVRRLRQEGRRRRAVG